MNVLVGQRRQVNVRPFGTNVTIPDDPSAKLMYYLHSVCVVVPALESNIGYLLDYERYWTLSSSAKQELLKWCVACSPDVFMNKVFFGHEDMENSNIFVELNQLDTNVLAAEEIVIAGVEVKVVKIMLCKRDWLVRNYFNPIMELNHELNRPRPQRFYIPPLRSSPAPSESGCCTIL